MEPYFSIIVPVYNVEGYVLRCVQSLLDQSCKDLEIILVDDGSTDGSGKICDDLAAQYPQISVVHKTNGGLSSARNEGLSQARGTYISFVDADDWMEQDAYGLIQSNLLAKQPDILNFGYQKRKNGEVLIREYAVFPARHYHGEEIRNILLPDSIARKKAFDQVNLPVQLSACMCVYRRDFLEQNGIQFVSEREVLCEDWLFNISCLCRAEGMVILHDFLYNYDTRETSLSSSYKPDSYVRRKKLYQSYGEELLKSGNDTPEIRHRLENFWMESVYCCYIIESNAPVWNREVRRRMQILSRDPLFLEYAAKLRPGNCTPKGLVFAIVTRLQLHRLFRLTYRLAKRR